MKNFTSDYAEIYNLLYRDKDYKGEGNYIQTLLSKVTDEKSLLEVGCGNGAYTKEFLSAGYQVTGVDISEEMIEQAKVNCPGGVFKVGDFSSSNLLLREKFSLFSALFHVINYQNTNLKLSNFFQNMGRSLLPGGVAVFDFWYGPGVLSDLPYTKEIEKENRKYYVKRKTVPTMNYNKNQVKVHFFFEVIKKQKNQKRTFEEVHRMRYLFLPEIEMLAEAAGMKMESSYKSFTFRPLQKDWYGTVILRRK